MDYDKGLKLFMEVLLDKEKSEQFLKECKAMGIEPQTEREINYEQRKDNTDS